MSRRAAKSETATRRHLDGCCDAPCTCTGRHFTCGRHTVVCGRAEDTALPRAGVLVWDPPWDYDASAVVRPDSDWTLAFTDGQRAGSVIELLGPPAWVYTWDTMATWSQGRHRPLKRTKLALLYGDMDRYDRDLGLVGLPPKQRTNPQCTYEPLGGSRLADCYQASLRWIAERELHPHGKPLEWVRALIGCCVTDGPVVDPFAGSGTAAVAAEMLGRASFSVELDPGHVQTILDRLSSPPTRDEPQQAGLFDAIDQP